MNSNKSKWDNRFFNIAIEISKWSKDKSTGVGAVIVDNNKRILSTGYNGFPINIDDNVLERYDRPLKYIWTEHAERNAIYNCSRAGISTINSSIYVTLFPCTDCSRAIIQAGIKRLISTKPDFEHHKWGENFKHSLEMLTEANIEITYIDNISKK